jgi:hypothetical protein
VRLPHRKGSEGAGKLVTAQGTTTTVPMHFRGGCSPTRRSKGLAKTQPRAP